MDDYLDWLNGQTQELRVLLKEAQEADVDGTRDQTAWADKIQNIVRLIHEESKVPERKSKLTDEPKFGYFSFRIFIEIISIIPHFRAY